MITTSTDQTAVVWQPRIFCNFVDRISPAERYANAAFLPSIPMPLSGSQIVSEMLVVALGRSGHSKLVPYSEDLIDPFVGLSSEADVSEQEPFRGLLGIKVVKLN